MGRIINKEEAEKIVKELREKGKTIVTTNGAFDLFHVGHLKSLRFAKKQADILIVGINTDSSIKRYKSEQRPIIPETQRASIVSSIDVVDYVILFDEDLPNNFLSIIKPDVHVKGSEYKNHLPERELIEKNGGKIVFIERDGKESNSTTEIIEKIRALKE